MDFIEQTNNELENEVVVDSDGGELPADDSSPEEISLARKQGWRPADEFKGSPGEFVSAKEFLDRGAQWAHNLKKEVEGLRDLVREQEIYRRTQLAKEQDLRQRQVKDMEHQIQELKALKVKAIDNNDGATIVKIDDQIEATKDAIAEAKVTVQQTQPVADAKVVETVNEWKSKNTWYGTDTRAARYANTVGDEYMQTHPGAQLNDVLSYVETETKKVFTQYGKQIPAGPDSGGSERGRFMTGGITRSNTPKWEALDDAGRKLGDEMIERGVFKNRSEYLEFYMDGDSGTGNVGRTLAKYKKSREAK